MNRKGNWIESEGLLIQINMKKLLLLLMIILFLPLGINAEITSNMRIVSLAPNITEILFYLNAGSKIVGVTSADNYPAQVSGITRIGNFDSPSLELITSLKPSMILSCGFLTHPVYPRLKQLGHQVTDYEPLTLRDIYNTIDDIGTRIGMSGKQSKKFQDKMNAFNALVRTKPKKKVALLFWDDPLLTVGGQSYLNDILRVAGCENVFAGEHRSYFQTDPESIVASNPDVIFLLMMQKRSPEFLQSVVLKPYLDSHKIQVIDTIDPDLFLRAGPRLADGVEKFLQVLKR